MASPSGRETLDRFYAAFAAADGAAMASCYTADAHFSDPVFPDLEGPEVGAMWRMLTARSADLTVTVEQLDADATSGTSTLVAHYLFGPDRRPVANRIRSRFAFLDGLILTQHDTFDLHAWAAQALGLKGRLLGWTPMVHNAVRSQAADQLRAFRAAEGASPATP